jgi:hypothetical protein
MRTACRMRYEGRANPHTVERLNDQDDEANRRWGPGGSDANALSSLAFQVRENASAAVRLALRRAGSRFELGTDARKAWHLAPENGCPQGLAPGT